MEIQLLRDLVIIISGIAVTVVAIVVAVTMTSIYRKVNDILTSTRTAAMKLEAMATLAGDELYRPMIQIAGFVQGVAAGIAKISEIFKKGG